MKPGKQGTPEKYKIEGVSQEIIEEMKAAFDLFD